MLSKKDIPKILAIVGATGSGKTDLAIQIAQKFNGEIICTDSVQVYREFDIGSAKPSYEKQQTVKHHQIDIVAPDEYYSAANFANDAKQCIQQILDAGKLPILTGGAGLYYRFAISQIAKIPPIPKQVKQQVNTWHQQGIAFCHQKLQEFDLKSANQLKVNDTTRILRALEVILTTGQSIREYWDFQTFGKSCYDMLSFGIFYERSTLYNRINTRTLEMMKAGWIEETQHLRQTYSPDLHALGAIGYKQIGLFLDQKISYELMVEKIQQKTRNYAKRQLTWFRKESDIQWFPLEHQQSIYDAIHQFLQVK